MTSPAPMRISNELQERFSCPSTKSKLQQVGGDLESVGDSSLRYPIIDGIPVLIDDEKSLFSINNFQKQENTTFDLSPSKFKQFVRALIPEIGRNIKAEQNYEEFCGLLPAGAKVLVIGGSVEGAGTKALYSNQSFEIVGADVSFGPQTKLICDAHDIPFEDETFDAVVVQAVLEHVLEPIRCVSELYRVLIPAGLIYAETPFMQQVHMKQYDFTRYTHLGHRRLFRRFEEVSSGPVCGPGMALAWAYVHFMTSFSRSYWIVTFLDTFARCSSFFLKYFDYYLIDKPGSYDAASGFYFTGRKSDQVLSDHDLIKEFKGVL